MKEMEGKSVSSYSVFILQYMYRIMQSVVSMPPMFVLYLLTTAGHLGSIRLLESGFGFI